MVAAPSSHSQNTAIEVFDRALLLKRRERALKNFKDHSFLFDISAKQLNERLSIIKRDFLKGRIIQIGGRGGALIEGAHIIDISQALGDEVLGETEVLSLEEQSCDLIISNLDIHSINDLPGFLIQLRRALKPDGLFLASMFGGESLYELRASLFHAETQLKGGLSPRVFPFADKQQMGALLQRAGFALPVVDSDLLTVSYPHIFKLMHDLRGMGESNIIEQRLKRNPGKALFMQAGQHYAEHYASEDGRIDASFEIIYLLGWAPHESQQKPLKPGSAEHSLDEALNKKPF